LCSTAKWRSFWKSMFFARARGSGPLAEKYNDVGRGWVKIVALARERNVARVRGVGVEMAIGWVVLVVSYERGT
jgi:hypothetical protein